MLMTHVFHQNDLWVLNHNVTYDGIEKLMTVNPGVSALDIRADLYSNWIEWIALRDYSKFLLGMRFTGLDPMGGSNFTGDTYFLQNGWKLIVDITKVKVTGVLLSDNYDTAYYDQNETPVYPATVSSLVSSVTLYQNVVTGDLSALPTLSEIEASSILAKQSTSTAIKAKTDTIDWNQITRLLGLTMENYVEDDIVRDGFNNKISSILYLYNSNTNATIHNKVTGIVAKYDVTASYDGNGKMQLFKVIQV